MNSSVDLILGIPTYNSEKYLDDLFLSLERLSVLPKRIVFSDDASADGTVSKLRTQMATHKSWPLELVLAERNQGLAANYNKLIALAGEEKWIQILDADDFVLGDYYNILKANLATTDANLVITSMRTQIRLANIAPQFMEAVEPKTFPTVLQPLGLWTTRSAFIYRTQVLKGHLFPHPFFDGSDIVHHSPLMDSNIYVPEAKVFYRIHSASMTSQNRSTDEYKKFLTSLSGNQKLFYQVDYFFRKKVMRFVRRYFRN